MLLESSVHYRELSQKASSYRSGPDALSQGLARSSEPGTVFSLGLNEWMHGHFSAVYLCTRVTRLSFLFSLIKTKDKNQGLDFVSLTLFV